MKQKLAALAVLAACGAVHAQSSVTLFGVLDATLAYGQGEGGDKIQLTNSGTSSSRLGIRGSEDLGGGLSASFWLEAGINNDDGQGAATNSNNQASGAGAGVNGRQGLTFNRRSTVSLAGSWGELRLGRDYTGHYRNRTDMDPFGTLGVGNSQANVGTLGGQTSTRASNAIGYFLPSGLGGFLGQAQVYFGENLGGTPTEDDGSGYSLRLAYAAGGLLVSGAFATQQFAAGDIVSTNLGAIYDFKMVKLMGAVYRDKTESAVSFSGEGYIVGGIVPVGSGEFKLAFSRYGSDAGLEPETKKLALGYVHNLSKRTALYATYARVTNSGGATTALNGSVTGPNQDSSGFDLGLRHSF
jgi:predicted porin